MKKDSAALPPFAVFLAVAAVFLPVLWSAGFVNWDDPYVLVDNPRLRGLTWDNLRWMATAFHMTTYQPATWLLYAVIHAIFGLDPRAYHAASVLLHAGNAALFASIVGRLYPERRVPAALVALLWALHPLQVQATAWVSALNDVWSTFLALCATLAYITWTEKSRARDYALAAFLFLLAGLARWKALCLPGLWLMIDFGALGRSWRQALPEKLPLFALAVLLARLTAAAKGLAVGAPTGWAEPSDAAVRAFFYVWRLVLPSGFSPLYSREFVSAGLPMASLAPWILAAATVGLAAFRRRGLLAWLGYLAAVAPACLFATRGPALAADHYAYLACMPLFLLLPRLGAPVLLAAAVALGAFSQVRARAWHDDLSLWSAALRSDPHSPVARTALASALIDAGRPEQAAPLLEEQIKLFPDDHVGAALAARVLPRKGRLEGRAAELSKLARADYDAGLFGPSLRKLKDALRLEPEAPELHAARGLVLYRLGRYPDSRAAFEKAVALDPSDPEARNGLGTALIRLNRPDLAEEQFAEAHRLSPGSERYRDNFEKAKSLR